MQIYNADIDIDLLEFSDRFGNIRSTAGCSFKGKVEFDARIKRTGEILQRASKKDPDKKVAQIYLEDKEFAHHCDRCLKLNGINPKWLTEVHLTELLFVHGDRPGALVLLNQANNPSSEVASRKSQVAGNIYHQFLGAMYNFSKDPEQAFRLAEERSFKEVAGMIQQASKKGKNKSTSPKTVLTGDRPTEKKGISDRSYQKLMAMREKIKG